MNKKGRIPDGKATQKHKAVMSRFNHRPPWTTERVKGSGERVSMLSQEYFSQRGDIHPKHTRGNNEANV